MGSDFGRGMGDALVGMAILIGVVCTLVGAAAAYLIPWLFHLIASHVVII